MILLYYVATPVGVAAGIATLKEMTKEALDRINSLGDSLAEGVQRVLADLNIKAQVTGYGSLHQIHFTPEPVTGKAKEAGIGWAFIRNTSHQGSMDYYPLMATNNDMAGIAFVCTPPGMAPYGARVAGVDNSG